MFWYYIKIVLWQRNMKNILGGVVDILLSLFHKLEKTQGKKFEKIVS